MRNDHNQRRGFTLLELLIVVSIVALLLGMLFVAINQARARARSVKCLNNVRQLALGVRVYTDQHNGRLPDGLKEPWFAQIAPCLESEPSVFRCPDDPQLAEQSYGWRDESVCYPPASLAGKRIDFIASSRLVMIFDQAPGWHAPGMINVAMVNSSAEAMEETAFEDNLLLGATSGTLLDLDVPEGLPQGE